jgi:signal peptidase I
MSTPTQTPAPPQTEPARHHFHLPTVPEVLASLLKTLVVALFLLTFVIQPFLIPSESMEHTLLVGDFLLVNKQVFAPSGGNFSPGRWIYPHRDIQRGDIVIFHHPDLHYPYLVKRVVGLPGDRLRMEDGRVTINGQPLTEPYVAFEPTEPHADPEEFPAKIYPDPQVDSVWWRQMQAHVNNGELIVPPGEYFVLGDNRNHSLDSRFWGFVPRQAIIARPLVIYFSLSRPSSTDVQQASNDRLGHDMEFSDWLKGFARWKRIFHVVR